MIALWEGLLASLYLVLDLDLVLIRVADQDSRGRRLFMNSSEMN
jgi:hypothetical protein